MVNEEIPAGYYRVSDGTLLPRPGKAEAEKAVRTLLLWMGQDPDRDGLKKTPDRVARAMQEMTVGYEQDPEKILGTVFEQEYDEMVILKDIPFTSLCEHHLLGFSGVVDIGYLPTNGVVGLSKLARLVDCFAMRLQIQEKLTKQIADAINLYLQPKGVGVIVRATHSCMIHRGCKKTGAEMVTSCCLGVLRDNATARGEFLSLCAK